jgi:hypothetical protein
MSYKYEILALAREAREKEVVEYQVNIDNFSLALERIGDDPDLQEFKAQISNLLSSSLVEQKKAKIMLDVILSQLE